VSARIVPARSAHASSPGTANARDICEFLITMFLPVFPRRYGPRDFCGAEYTPVCITRRVGWNSVFRRSQPKRRNTPATLAPRPHPCHRHGQDAKYGSR
jgi:hypothetical protein